MGKIKFILPFFMVMGMPFAMGQTVEVTGQLLSNDDVEGIHIINQSSGAFTISDSDGVFFMPVKLNDTLVFSGVSYEEEKIIVGYDILNSKSLTVYLTEKITVLDEVVVGKLLKGDLSSDIAKSGVERPINFFDLGIPGYTGKPKTQSERRLFTAGDFKPIHLLSLLGGSLQIDPILNAISGRTKELKYWILLENRDKCLEKIRSNFSEILFKASPLEEPYRNEFFYFCADDDQFDALCMENNDFKTLEFLKDKLESFNSLLQLTSEE